MVADAFAEAEPVGPAQRRRQIAARFGLCVSVSHA
jgi:hypothetical protein